ncbi:hypothetical protein [Roseivirga pacifica]|uniref:hypothetical protein n=1 Tax=Roseivirga pacifica TaxID=1267423 RepID=UPI003BAF00FE
MAKIFKTESFQDESVRLLYDYIIERAQSIFKVFKDVYTVNSKDKNLLIQYYLTSQFQAEASKSNDLQYNIGVHSPTILLTRTMFDLLLTHEPIGRNITGDIRNADLVKFKMVHDVRRVMKHQDVLMNNDPDRMLVSSVLTDLCGTFIVLHEIGHIVLGHVESANTHFGDDQVVEIFSFKRRKKKEAEIRQAMEHDADMIAARLIPQYIEQLFTKIQEDKRYQVAFKEIINSKHPFEKLTSICLASIYAIFVYMFGPNTVEDFRYTAHHHPLTRVRTVVNGIVHTLAERWDLDSDLMIDLYLDNLDEINIVFTRNGIINHSLFSKDFFNTMDDDVKRILDVASANRHLSHPYSWLPDTEWSMES